MAEIITPISIADTKRNIDDIDKTLNTKQIIKPLWGDEFKSLPLAIQEVIETGGFEPFATEEALRASVPILTKKAAKAMDTKKIWLWEGGAWFDTGLSDKDQAIEYANANALFKPIRLNGSRHHTLITEVGYFHVPTVDVATAIGMPVPAVGMLFGSGRSWGDSGNIYHIFTTNQGDIYVNTLDSVAGDKWLGWKTEEVFHALDGAPDLNTDLAEGNIYIAGALFATAEKGYPFQRAGYLIRKKNSSNYYNQTYITQDGIAVRYGLLNAETNKPDYDQWKGVRYASGITDLSAISTLTPLLTAPIIKPVRLTGDRNHEDITEVGYFHVPTTGVAVAIGMPVASIGMLFSSGYSWASIAGNIYHIFTTNDGNVHVNTFDDASKSWLGWKSKTQSLDLSVSRNTLDILNLKKNGFSDKTSKLIEKGQVYQTKSGAIKDTANRYDYFSCWGSSTIELMGPKLRAMANSYGITNTIEEGKGSEIAETVGARFGSFKLVVNPVTIPASGSVAISTNLPAVSNIWYIKRFKVDLGGIQGDIYWDTSSLVFERDLAGDATVFNAETVAVPIFDQKFRDGILVINNGKNNLTSADTTINTAEGTFNETVALIDHVRSLFKKIIILDQYVDIYTAAASPVRTRIAEYNQRMKDKYGDLVLDCYDYLCDQAFIDNGTTKTQLDLDQIDLGNLPYSWSADTWHMNGFAENLIINNLIKPKLEALEWVDTI